MMSYETGLGLSLVLDSMCQVPVCTSVARGSAASLKQWMWRIVAIVEESPSSIHRPWLNLQVNKSLIDFAWRTGASLAVLWTSDIDRINESAIAAL